MSGILDEHIGYHRPERPVDSEEFCTRCGKKLGFSQLLRADDPKRFEDGMVYDHGGQLCAECARSSYPTEVRFDMGCG